MSAPTQHEDLADQIHTQATIAEKATEQICTLLGQAGADPAAVDACTKMADVLRRIATGVAKGGTPEHGAAQAAPETMDSATAGMMADHAAARQAAQ